MQRSDGRALDQIRAINFELNIAPHASGSVLVAMGNTRVICGVTIEEIVPRWMKDQGRHWRLAHSRVFDAALFHDDTETTRHR